MSHSQRRTGPEVSWAWTLSQGAQKSLEGRPSATACIAQAGGQAGAVPMCTGSTDPAVYWANDSLFMLGAAGQHAWPSVKLAVC